MALSKIADLYPNYKDDIFNGEDLKDFSVYSYEEEKIGSVHDILVDDTGHFRYFVVDTGFWIFGKKVLLPVGRVRVDYAQQRVYTVSFTKEQAENLPEYDDDMTLDYDYEERVRGVYRNDAATPRHNATATATAAAAASTYDRNSYNYDNDAALYRLDNNNHGNLSRYQQSLMGHRDSFQATRGAGLYKIRDLYPNYRSIFGNDDLMDYSFYSATDEKVGSIKDILVDRDGRIRYFVVDTGFWVFGKKVLLPVGRARLDSNQKRIYAMGLSKEQAENLPEYDDDMTVDYDYEERVRGVYRNESPMASATRGNMATATSASTATPRHTSDRNSYSYDNDAALYRLDNNNHGNLPRYQQSLMSHRDSFQATRGAGLYKIRDLYPNYRSIFGNDDLMDYSFYSATDEKVGSIKDILVDRDGRIRYFVVDTGFWVFGKKVLLPVGRARLDSNQKRIYAMGLSKEQAENLPEYDDDMTVDYDYEERVRGVYRNDAATPMTNGHSRNMYNYDREPNLYQVNENEHQKLKLYEERLIANKERFRTGSVTVGKKVETEIANIAVPVEKERIVVERHTPTDSTSVQPGKTAFQEGEVARVEVYEETANIEKQAFVREEVSVRKEVERDTVSANETIRREELDIDTEGDATINKQNM